jgi:hypothetical protein
MQNFVKVFEDGREVGEIPEENIPLMRHVYEKKGMGQNVFFINPKDQERNAQMSEELKARISKKLQPPVAELTQEPDNDNEKVKQELVNGKKKVKEKVTK